MPPGLSRSDSLPREVQGARLRSSSVVLTSGHESEGQDDPRARDSDSLDHVGLGFGLERPRPYVLLPGDGSADLSNRIPARLVHDSDVGLPTALGLPDMDLQLDPATVGGPRFLASISEPRALTLVLDRYPSDASDLQGSALLAGHRAALELMSTPGASLSPTSSESVGLGLGLGLGLVSGQAGHITMGSHTHPPLLTEYAITSPPTPPPPSTPPPPPPPPSTSRAPPHVQLNTAELNHLLAELTFKMKNARLVLDGVVKETKAAAVTGVLRPELSLTVTPSTAVGPGPGSKSPSETGSSPSSPTPSGAGAGDGPPRPLSLAHLGPGPARTGTGPHAGQASPGPLAGHHRHAASVSGPLSPASTTPSPGAKGPSGAGFGSSFTGPPPINRNISAALASAASPRSAPHAVPPKPPLPARPGAAHASASAKTPPAAGGGAAGRTSSAPVSTVGLPSDRPGPGAAGASSAQPPRPVALTQSPAAGTGTAAAAGYSTNQPGPPTRAPGPAALQLSRPVHAPDAGGAGSSGFKSSSSPGPILTPSLTPGPGFGGPPMRTLSRGRFTITDADEDSAEETSSPLAVSTRPSPSPHQVGPSAAHPVQAATVPAPMATASPSPTEPRASRGEERRGQQQVELEAEERAALEAATRAVMLRGASDENQFLRNRVAYLEQIAKSHGLAV